MRLIDADALEPDAEYDDGEYWAYSRMQIENAPTIEPHRENGYRDGYKRGKRAGYKKARNAGRKKGKWMHDGHHIRCTECGVYVCETDREGDAIPRNYCPNCGVRMEEGGE